MQYASVCMCRRVPPPASDGVFWLEACPMLWTKQPTFPLRNVIWIWYSKFGLNSVVVSPAPSDRTFVDFHLLSTTESAYDLFGLSTGPTKSLMSCAMHALHLLSIPITFASESNNTVREDGLFFFVRDLFTIINRCPRACNLFILFHFLLDLGGDRLFFGTFICMVMR